MSAKCNRDCFNCPFEDCINSSPPFTEGKDIQYLIYKQDQELKIKRAVYMHNNHVPIKEIAAILKVPENEAASLLATNRGIESRKRQKAG